MNAVGSDNAVRPGSHRGVARGTSRERLASPVSLGLLRAWLELKLFFRRREAVIFTFALPVVLLVVFGSIFHGTIGNTGVSYRQYFTAGIIASGIMSVTFVNLGIAIALERDAGTLKRLAGTPLPKAAYFLGKAVSALVIAVAETAILLAIGVAFYGLHLPATAGRWLTFAWVLVLGALCCTMLGIAASSLPRSARSAAAVLNLPYLVLQFISGVYFPFTSLPKGMQEVAAVFPLKWLCQGLRSVFLPDSARLAEPAHMWEHGTVALVLAAWLIGSLAVCLKTFRWQSEENR
ncbi:MAG TPA: ABC transporter permease [Streptosporangiaceae bacterium]|nr:ABC transporter permease [Streptosporangiaceae bacterium]